MFLYSGVVLLDSLMHNSGLNYNTCIDNQMLNLVSRRQKHLLALSLMLAAGFYLAVVVWAGYDDIAKTMQKISAFDWGLLLLCSLCNYSLRFVRWHLYARYLHEPLVWTRHYLYYLAGFALTTTPAKAGELLRSVYLKQHGLPYYKSIAMFVTERFLDVLVIATLAMLTVFLFGDYGRFVILATGIFFVMLLLIKSPLFQHILQYAHHLIPFERAKKLLSHLLGLLTTAQQLLNIKLLSFGLLLGIIAWSIQGVAFYYILQQLQFDILLATAMGIYAISLLAGAATFVPGGVGGTEVMMALLLNASGADASIAITAPLISRLSTLWFAVGVGFTANVLISRLPPETT